LNVANPLAESTLNPVGSVCGQNPHVNGRDWNYSRDGTRMRGSDVRVPWRCGHKLRRTNPPRYCMSRCLRGYDACKRHYGGPRQNGITNPNYRNGQHCQDRYDRYLSGNLHDMYTRHLEDPDYMSLSSEMGILRTIVSELLAKLDRGEGESLWTKLVAVHRRLASSIREGDKDAMRTALGDLAETIERGSQDAGLRRQLQNAIKTLVIASKGEWKRQHDLAQMLPRQTVERMLLIENQLLTEVFKDKALIREYRKRTYKALLPVLGRPSKRG